jgi:polygalacturonase
MNPHLQTILLPRSFLLLLAFLVTFTSGWAQKITAVDVASYPSLQAAIDANPGKIIRIPAGEYEISAALVIKADNTELYGPARIVQTNPKEAMLTITGAKRVRVNDLSFTRAEGQQEAVEHGVQIIKCDDVIISRVQVSENHTRSSIMANDCKDVTIENCVITNFKGPTIDDRTDPKHLSGYAFKSIDGTGIQIRSVRGAIIRDNRIQELRLLPTKEMHDKYGLGKLTVVPEVRGRLMSEEIFKTHYTNNWHQGAAIQVTGPDITNRVIISGNYIEHAPQGIDIHADNIVVTGNIISHAMIGMKAMHGAKNVLIDGNQFTYVDLWGIVLMTGASSRANGQKASNGSATVGENIDGGHIISNNIISNFGLGLQDWNWEGRNANRCAIYLPTGQLEENPPLRNVIITGNQVFDSGKDGALVDGKWEKVAPRYNYALWVEQSGVPSPQNVKVYGNLFDAGAKGVTNLPDGDIINPPKVPKGS